jgi:type II secretory pathway component GspD/PulD (secretin)
VTTTTTTGSNSTTTTESVTFIDVGIQLAVTPTINDDGYVTIKVKPEISSVQEYLTTPSGNRIPIIDSSLAETTIMVKDGVSIIIGGLKKDENMETRKKVPFLGDLPFIGGPFNSTTKSNVHSELLILLTPHIVEGDKLTEGPKQPGETSLMSYVDYEDYGSSSPAAPTAASPKTGSVRL